MIWSAQTIIARTCEIGWKALCIEPFYAEKSISFGMSFGLTAAGYDIRLGRPSSTYNEAKSIYVPPEGIYIPPGKFNLGHSLEFIKIPEDCQAIVHDKSSLARRGLSLFNTVLEPGWKGHITLELANQGIHHIFIPFGCPIAQLVFHQLDSRTQFPYSGKYQNQPNYPIPSLREGELADSEQQQ